MLVTFRGQLDQSRLSGFFVVAQRAELDGAKVMSRDPQSSEDRFQSRRRFQRGNELRPQQLHGLVEEAVRVEENHQHLCQWGLFFSPSEDMAKVGRQ